MIKILKFVPVQLTAFLILGILLGKRYFFAIEQLTFVSIIFLFIFLGIFLLFNRKPNFSYLVSIFAFIIFLFIGFVTINYHKIGNQKKHYSYSSFFKEGEVIPIRIVVSKELKSNHYYKKYEVEVKQINDVNCTGKVLLQLKKDSVLTNFEVDSEVYLLSEFKAINPPLNPYEFNYKAYLNDRQIYHQIIVDKNDFIILNTNLHSLSGWASKLRKVVNTSLKQNGFRGEELAIINALLLGQRRFVSKELLQNYSNAGAIHILAVSGLHVGIIMLILSFLLKPLHFFKNGKWIAMALVLMVLWFYAIIAGLSPSIVRAVTMFTALTIGLYVNKPTNVFNTLFISMFFLLMFNPMYLFEVGFQLSYLAVFSIVWLQPKLYQMVKLKFWVFNKIWQLFTVSLTAQLGVLPLSLYYFHQFPGLFFVSNLVIIPFLGFILSFGIIVIIAAIFNVLPHFIGNIFKNIIDYLNTFINWVSSQETFILTDVWFSFEAMVCSYLMLLFAILFLELKRMKLMYVTLVWILVFQGILFVDKYEKETENAFIVFNKSRKSLMAVRKGKNLQLYTNIDSLNNQSYPLKPYLVEENLKNFEIESLLNFYHFNDEKILVIDEKGLFNFRSVIPSIILLRNSPKINLERLMTKLQPKLIVADASNYKSYVKLWKETCKKNKTPFYSTQQKGAFVLSNN